MDFYWNYLKKKRFIKLKVKLLKFLLIRLNRLEEGQEKIVLES